MISFLYFNGPLEQIIKIYNRRVLTVLNGIFCIFPVMDLVY